MKFITKVTSQPINDAVKFCNELAANQSFWDTIAEKDKFDYSEEYLPKDIAEAMRSYMDPVEVVLYQKPWWLPWWHRNTNAYTDPKSKDVIFINSRRMNRSLASICNTIVHEFVHVIDFCHDGDHGVNYGHGSQGSSGKKNTAPYWIGQQAEDIFNHNAV